MRKERPLRESMQTETQQQPNSEKTNRRRNKRTGRVNKRLRRKHPPHKRNEEDKRNEQTVYSNSTNQRDKERFYNRCRITYLNNATRRKIMKATEMQKITNRYQDVNKNEVKFRGKIPVNREYENNKQKMEILITERTDITPILGMDWMKTFKLTIGRIQLAENNQSVREKYCNKFPDLFVNNETKKDNEIKIQLKSGHYPVKQKARPVPLHLQKDVERELERLIKSGHLEKVNNVDEDCFVSPVVLTVKSDKSVKIALDSRKLHDSCIKMRLHMPNNAEHGRISKSDFG